MSESLVAEASSDILCVNRVGNGDEDRSPFRTTLTSGEVGSGGGVCGVLGVCDAICFSDGAFNDSFGCDHARWP